MPKRKIVKNNRKKPKFQYSTHKLALTILLLILTILATVIYQKLQVKSSNSARNDISPTSMPETLDAEPTIAVYPADTVSLVKARQLLVNYFDHLKDPATETNQRITDYSIDSLSGEMSDKYLLIQITYSVKPMSSNSIWEGPSGISGADGWIRKIHGCTPTKKQDNNFSAIQGLGTGCLKLQYQK